MLPDSRESTGSNAGQKERVLPSDPVTDMKSESAPDESSEKSKGPDSENEDHHSISSTIEPETVEVYIEGAIQPTVRDVELHREKARSLIALSLTGLVALVLGVTLFGASFGNLDKDHIELILTAGLPPIVTLLGTAMGFYFGSSK